MIRRSITAALTLTLILGTTQGQGSQADTRPDDSGPVASRNASRGPCDEDRYVVRPAMGAETVERKVAALIRCAVRRYSVPGGAATALRIARCESGEHLWPWAYSNGNAGVFQQRIAYWPGRARAYLRASWFPVHYADVVDHGWFRARANVLVSIRMAHAGGWGPWSCA